MWYMIRKLRCTVTIDSVLVNSKTQNAFLFTVNAIFLHDYPLAVEHGSTQRPIVQKKLGEILYSRRDLRITLYFRFDVPSLSSPSPLRPPLFPVTKRITRKAGYRANFKICCMKKRTQDKVLPVTLSVHSTKRKVIWRTKTGVKA